ncbi:flagellar motor switch protein FliN [Melioribacteraceae bacterium 4301-Me]|uniref:flagellar motor switch protein FliN n=1 Tax=Pyranulibacter aquaticus TaxID=3163344 RepID=UPI00359A485D
MSQETELKNENTQEEKQAEPQSEEQVKTAEFEEFDESTLRGSVTTERLNFIRDLQLNVFIELGRTKMLLKDILELERGYVIELDKLASEPVDIYVNNKKVAEGEVVVIDKHFGIRITNLIDTSDRLKGIL